MLFKEIIAVFWESYETYKYKIQIYWVLTQAVHIVATRLQSVEGFWEQDAEENIWN
jgi:hypothetical protein